MAVKDMFKANKLDVQDLIQSPGILDDFAIRKNILTASGKIQRTPTADDDIVNKKYVDDSIVGGSQTPWIADIDAAGYSLSGAGVISGAYIYSDVMSSPTITNLSGSVVVISTNLTGLSGAVLNLSGSTTAQISTLSGQRVILTNNLDNLSGSVLSLSGALTTLSGAYKTHATDASDPHGSNITQSNLSGGCIYVTNDWAAESGAYVCNVIYGQSATPPTASNYTQGSIYFQYAP